jgi:hypothetical protein
VGRGECECRLPSAFDLKLLARTPGCEWREEERRGRAWRYPSFLLAAAAPGLPEEAFSHFDVTCTTPASVNGCQSHPTPAQASSGSLRERYSTAASPPPSTPAFGPCSTPAHYSAKQTPIPPHLRYPLLSTLRPPPSTLYPLLLPPPPAVAAPLKSSALARPLPCDRIFLGQHSSLVLVTASRKFSYFEEFFARLEKTSFSPLLTAYFG